MKKFISTILCMAMLFGVSACGASTVPSATPSQSNANVNEAYNQAVSNSLTFISDYSVLLDMLKTVDGKANRGDYRSADDTDVSADGDGAAESNTASGSAGKDYSGTNTQVAGVDEGDIVKTDGAFIYVISGYELVIFKADGPNTKELSRMTIGYDENAEGKNEWSYTGKNPSELYVYGERLAIVSPYYSYHDFEDADGKWQYESDNYLTVDIYDISDPTAPTIVCSLGQDGGETASRMIDGKIYVVSGYFVNNFDESDPVTYVPCTYRDGEKNPISADRISIMPEVSSTSYAVIGVYDMEGGTILSSQTVLGAGDTVYMNDKNLYFAATDGQETAAEPYKESVYDVTDYSWRSATEICRFSISDGVVTPGAVVTLPGTLNNQFSLDEYGGRLRVVTTLSGYNYKIYRDAKMGFENYVAGDNFESSGALYILDVETLQSVGNVMDLAKGEYVNSVRFDGDWAYFCTFAEDAPLFAVDVSDPEKPVVVSELGITGFSDYLHVWTDGLLFGLGQEAVVKAEGGEEPAATDGMRLVMFDTSDKANVTAASVTSVDADWSEALNNHKAILIDYEKNIIGFPAGDGYDIYGWTAEQGFFLRARIATGATYSNMRGVYIGEYVYVLSDKNLSVIDLKDFILAATIDF